jgi:hypothetical protein
MFCFILITYVSNLHLISHWTKRQEEFEETKGVIRIHKSKKHIGQKKNDKQLSTKHTHKTKDRVTRTQVKTSGELRCSGRIGSSCSTSGTHHVNLVTNLVINHELGKDR